MPNAPRRLVQLSEVPDAGIADSADLVDALLSVVDTVRELVKGVSDRVDALEADEATERAGLENRLGSADQATKTQLDAVARQVDQLALKAGPAGQNGKDGKDGKNGKDGKPGAPGPAGKNGRDGKDGQDGKDGSPDTPEQVRDKLETLAGTPSALRMEAVFGLVERLDALSQQIQRSHGSVIAYSRGQIKLYDLSDQLNGVTKTFSLPSFWRVLLVQSTSTPNAFRPTVDYTTSSDGMTITFTSQIDASTTLAAGQTLTVLYAEP